MRGCMEGEEKAKVKTEIKVEEKAEVEIQIEEKVEEKVEIEIEEKIEVEIQDIEQCQIFIIQTFLLMPYNNFTQMPVWQLALEIVEDVYKITDKPPKREDYALCSQLRDAAISIAGNIAEGFGRGHKKDKINFYYYSRGSAFEVMSHIFCGIKAGYFSENEIQPICDKCNNCAESLNKIIKTLTNSKP